MSGTRFVRDVKMSVPYSKRCEGEKTGVVYATEESSVVARDLVLESS